MASLSVPSRASAPVGAACGVTGGAAEARDSDGGARLDSEPKAMRAAGPVGLPDGPGRAGGAPGQGVAGVCGVWEGGLLREAWCMVQAGRLGPPRSRSRVGPCLPQGAPGRARRIPGPATHGSKGAAPSSPARARPPTHCVRVHMRAQARASIPSCCRACMQHARAQARSCMLAHVGASACASADLPDTGHVQHTALLPRMRR
jgi:hypothetical protein